MSMKIISIVLSVNAILTSAQPLLRRVSDAAKASNISSFKTSTVVLTVGNPDESVREEHDSRRFVSRAIDRILDTKLSKIEDDVVAENKEAKYEEQRELRNSYNDYWDRTLYLSMESHSHSHDEGKGGKGSKGYYSGSKSSKSYSNSDDSSKGKGKGKGEGKDSGKGGEKGKGAGKRKGKGTKGYYDDWSGKGSGKGIGVGKGAKGYYDDWSGKRGEKGKGAGKHKGKGTKGYYDDWSEKGGKGTKGYYDRNFHEPARKSHVN